MTEAVQGSSAAVDPAENRASVTVTIEHRYEIEDLFGPNGELRLWQDSHGWSGLLHEDGAFYRVNYHERGDEFVAKEPLSLDEVRVAIARHVADPDAGGLGKFVRGCSPP